MRQSSMLLLVRDAARRVLKPLEIVTPLGRVVAAAAVAAWFVAWRLGWDEFATIAAAGAIALLLALLFTLGRDRLEIELSLTPNRVIVGETSIARLMATNRAGHRVLPFRIEVAIGEAVAQAEVPSLGAEGEHEELFVLPTTKRCVIPVGPATSLRGDPVGLMSRKRVWSEVQDLFVHPNIAPLSSLASGWIRDLEGLVTKDLAVSDVTFHTLREYVPGDDRRHVHWRTSARIGSLMVRQFVDTRRSHLAIVLDTSTTGYANEEEFELAVSSIASLGVRALRDEQAVSCIAGGGSLSSATMERFLDGTAGIEFGSGPADLRATVATAVPALGSASVIALVSGSKTSFAEFRLAAERFPANLRVISMRCDIEGDNAFRPVGETVVLNVAELDAVERLLSAAGA